MLSDSKIAAYYRCPRYYKYRYIDKYRLIEKDPYIGTFVHDFLKEYLITKDNAWLLEQVENIKIPIDSQRDQNKLEFIRWTASALTMILYNEISSIIKDASNVWLERKFRCKGLRGIIDLMYEKNDKIYLLDYKILSQFGKAVDCYYFASQSKFYTWAVEELTEKSVVSFIYFLVKIPGIRMKKGENSMDFNGRLQEYYIKRWQECHTKIKIERERINTKNIPAIIKQTKKIIKQDKLYIPISSPYSCSTCDYNLLCQEPNLWETWYTKGEK